MAIAGISGIEAMTTASIPDGHAASSYFFKTSNDAPKLMWNSLPSTTIAGTDLTPADSAS